MHRIRSLSVSQSMVLIFLSGMLTAAIFAALTIAGEVRTLVQSRGDGALVSMSRDAGDLVHLLQLERGATATWLTRPDAVWRMRVLARRAATDEGLARFGGNPAAASTADTDRLARRLATSAGWLARHRVAVDDGGIDVEGHLATMTRRNRQLIADIAHLSDVAVSPALQRLLDETALILRAKDEMGLYRAMGARTIARVGAGNALDTEAVIALREIEGQIAGAMAMYDLQAATADSLELELVQRMRGWQDLLRWRTDLRGGGSPAIDLPTPARWFDTATEVVDAMQRIEVRQMAAMATAVDAHRADLRAGIASKLIVFLGLVVCFGGLAIIALRSVRRSLDGIVRTICRLTVDVDGTEIESYPQRDLDQIAEALRILKSAQQDRHRADALAEDMRGRFDRQVDAMLDAVSEGRTGDRLEVIDLDAPSAVLARGINRLLDQLDHGTPIEDPNAVAEHRYHGAA